MVTRLALALPLALMASAVHAEPLEFSADPGPALNIARSLLGQERGDPLHDDEIVSIALIDLDNDGTRDIIAFADASYFCGTAGCIPRVYRLERDTGKWSELPIDSEATLNGEPTMWTVGDTDASGWHTLEFNNELVRLDFHWNGEAFVN